MGVHRKKIWDKVIPIKKRKPLSKPLKRKVLEYYSYKCVYCNCHASVVDHVIPYSYSGDNSFGNLVASCTACNSIASDKLFDNLATKIEYIRHKRNLASNYTHAKFIEEEWLSLNHMERQTLWITCTVCKGKFQSGRSDHGKVIDNNLGVCHLCLKQDEKKYN